ncbi:hypothetical protein ANANG_G00044610 [Anguilla anguilla]|uniref:Fibrosin n=1 Tax=Anguilla anguilla TaxID=7936 RepID=A0A9D3MUM4_ANGAN|nr:hypothetical protein ANANG_G00044610 [Anguilla anguilla]
MTSRNVFLETGYICDSESESGDKASDYEMEPMFTVTARKVLESGPVSMGSSVTKSHPPSSSICGLPRLSVTPRVSGLQRSQERSLEPLHPDSLSSSFSSSTSTSSCIPTYSLTTYVSCTSATTTVPGQRNGDGHFQRCAPSPPQPKPKPFLSYPGPPLSHYTIGLSSRNSTSAKPPPSSSASSSSLRPPTPSMNITLSLGCGPGFPGSMRPPSHPSSGAIFSPSSGLPPPPPLLQVPSHPTTGMATSTAAVLTELNSRFLTSQTVEREGGGSASGNQFHQHNHQHQHTHTHQHFAPFLPPSAAASPLFDKYPGKMESLYRHPFFPQYPTSMSGMPPVLPPAGPFSSLQGAFQPKGTSPEMAARLGPVPHRLQSKDPRFTDPFRTSVRINNKPGKWCAMHVRVAWMILRHQEKVKLLQVDPHKLDFRNNLLSRLPGAGGFGGLRGIGAQGSGLPSAHELARPASLFTASGGVHPSASTFAPPSTPHSSFITPSAHLDPFGRSPPFSSLGSLGTGAFGGLGSPSLGTNSVFGHKESQGGAVGSLANPHDPWNRLHHTPPSFPTTPTWVKGMDKREERVKEAEKKEVVHIKDEKDRDNSYGRHPVRMSPAAPSLKLCSSTPVSHSSSLGWAVGSSGAAIEAYLGVAGSSGGIVVGAAGDRFPTHPHAALQGHSQSPHGFPWDPWRELAAQQQQREVLTMRPDSHLALRTDPHLARLLQHQQVQRFFEAERAVAAVVGPHHPPASSSSTRQEFGLLSHHHHQERPPQASGPIGSLLEEDQRAHILREDFERVRYYGMHPHAHLSNPLLSGASHAAHLDQLHPGLLSHAHSHQPGSSPRHPNLYSRLGPLHPHSHHVPNGLLTKTASGLVGPLSVGAPPPLIPSVTPSRASTSPRNSRVGGGPELVLYSAPKDRESR